MLIMPYKVMCFSNFDIILFNLFVLIVMIVLHWLSYSANFENFLAAFRWQSFSDFVHQLIILTRQFGLISKKEYLI